MAKRFLLVGKQAKCRGPPNQPFGLGFLRLSEMRPRRRARRNCAGGNNEVGEVHNNRLASDRLYRDSGPTRGLLPTPMPNRGSI